jgi:hypothetical protein
MKLTGFGNMKHFTRTFANLSEASNQRILKEMTPITILRIADYMCFLKFR